MCDPYIWSEIYTPLNRIKYIFCICFAGYDQIPIDSMQGLEIGSGFGMDMDIGETEGAGAASADLAFPEPPHDNNNVAAWYDTDL